MSLTAAECALIAQIAPLLLLAVVVERKEVAALPKTERGRGVWLWVVAVYGVMLAFAMIGGVAWSSSGVDGPLARILWVSFWGGVGGAGVLLWFVFRRSFPA